MTIRAAHPAVICATFAAAALGVLALPARAARDDLELASRTTGGLAADGRSDSADISADGRFVLFTSSADNLSADDDDGSANVFVRDMDAGTTTLVNRTQGLGGAAAIGSGVWLPAISGDGSRVAFDSPSDNLSAADDNRFAGIFVRDLPAGTTTFASRADGVAGAAADGSSFEPAISGDGRVVAFSSSARTLTDEDDDTPIAPGFFIEDVFVRDLAASTTRLVSRMTGLAGTAGSAGSFGPSLSGDGRYVAFSSQADNLSTADVDTYSNVFVRDTVLGATTLVTRATGADGAAANDFSGSASISDDGRFVAFASSATNLSPADGDPRSDVYVRDTLADTTVLVSSLGEAPTGHDARAPAISGDGRVVTWESGPPRVSETDSPLTNVYVRDLQAGRTALVSRAAGAAGAPGDGPSGAGAISGDGRYVAFRSDAHNLSDGAGAVRGVFRRDANGPVAPGGASAGPGSGPGPGGALARLRCAGVRATLVGTARRDIVRGTSRRDVIVALGGDDLVLGRGGNDLICLGAGNDRGAGGPGADRILGGPGRDLLLGGPGRDRLLGLGGRDRALGGPGRDRCVVERRGGC